MRADDARNGSEETATASKTITVTREQSFSSQIHGLKSKLEAYRKPLVFVALQPLSTQLQLKQTDTHSQLYRILMQLRLAA